MLNPLMYEALLPDSRTVSRDAARHYALIADREERGEAGRPRLRAWRLGLRAWRLPARLRLRYRTRPARPVPQS